MGAPWSWNSTGYTAPIAFKFSYTLYNPSIFSSFNTRPSRILSFSSPRPSSSSSSSSSSRSLSSRDSDSRLRKPIKSDDPNSKSVTIEDSAGNEIASFSSTAIRPQRSATLIFKSLFRKRSLWRRILFSSKKVRSIILLNVLTIVYASNIAVVKEVEEVMDPAVFTVVRFAMTAIPFLPFVLRARGDIDTRNAGIELGVWVGLGYLMQTLGLLTSDVGRASFISMLTVIIVPFLDGLLGSIIPTRTWFGALMSVVGVAMLEADGSPPCVGDLLNFLSAVFFGVHMLRTEHIARNTKKENFLPLLGFEVCAVASLSILWYFIGGLIGGTQEVDSSTRAWTISLDWVVQFPWIPALYTGIFSSGLCLWIEMAAMCDISATETAIIYGLEPVWGGGFAWLLLGERWGLMGWIGAALVLGGSLTVQIFASSSSSNSLQDEQSKKTEHLLDSKIKRSLSASPIVVNSRKDVPDIFKK